jgi:rare lipoprotein A
VESGGASWYGRKFHGQPTANGEIYDMYAMTAAHKTMPLPSYALVRNPAMAARWSFASTIVGLLSPAV